MRKDSYLNIPMKSRARYTLPVLGGVSKMLDEAATDLKYASDYRNFCYDKGVLTDGWGIELHPLLGQAQNVTAAWEHVGSSGSESVRIPMYSDESGAVHALKDGVDTVVEGVSLTSPPIALNYRLYGEDVTLICSPTDGMSVYDGEKMRRIEPSPAITGMVLHYERLFVTTADERSYVRFSDDLDPTNWAEGLDSGGFVQLADGYGRTNKVVSFLSYIYIFRDYGISRMIAYADQTEFSVSNLYVSSGRIFPSSVTVCGDRIIFLASDGLYSFDGLDTTRLLARLGELTGYKETAVGRYYDGKYYLAYSSGGGVNDSLLVYDIARGTAQLSHGVRIDGFYGGDSLAGISDGRVVEIQRNGSVLGTPTEKVWRVPFGALGSPDRCKKIESVSLETATDITLKVLCDHCEKILNVRGGEGITTLPVNMTGKKIGLEITANNCGTRIASLAFNVKGA